MALATACAVALASTLPSGAVEQPAAVGPFLDGAFPALDPTVGEVQPPSRLSETGAFRDLAALAPHSGFLSYDVNTPLWSDGASKLRWMAVPHDGSRDAMNEKVIFAPEAPWTFPAGTVFMKHFEINTDERDPAQRRRLETRFMVITSGDYYGVTYRWRPDGSDADLLPDKASDVLVITEPDGGTREQIWDYPGRADCRICHNSSAGIAIGPRTHQLNGAHSYSGESTPENQLASWNSLGLFTPAMDPAEIAGLPRAFSVEDESASVADRIRSYLDVNCAMCHHPGNLSTSFDLRYATPLDAQNIVNGSVLYNLGVSEARVVAPGSLNRSILHHRMSTAGIHKMPPIGRNVVHETAVDLIAEWILSLPVETPAPGNSSPAAADDEGLTIAGQAAAIPAFGNDLDADGDALALYQASEPANGSTAWSADGVVTYLPRAGFTGNDSFTYSVVDEGGAVSNTATIRVTVSAPVASGSVAFQDGSALLANPSHASGVAMGVVDMNQDGLDDIVHFDGAELLYIDYQTPGGSGFTQRFVSDFDDEWMWGLAIGDADNDGYPDLVTGGYYDGLHYFRSDGTGEGFSRVDLTSSLVFLQAVSFADIDEDGWLDLFACHDEGDNAKFRNLGTGEMVADSTLIDTTTTPASDNSGNYGMVWTDYDGDGDLDMYLSKCRSGVSDPADPRRINALFRNESDGTYTEVAAAAGLNFGEQSWTADFGDVDNDGDLDCFVANHMAPSYLLRNAGGGRFVDVTAESGIAVEWNVVQSIFRDFNNDGWLDLLLTGKEHGLWLNDRDGTFTKMTDPFPGGWIQSGAVGDLNNDLFPDLYAGYAHLYNSPNPGRPDRLFFSEPNGNNALAVTLRGVQSNTLASGARLELHGPWGIQVREVRSGEGYGITNSFTQIFGMGNQATADRLVVRWPSGTVDVARDLVANQFLTLREGSTAPPHLTRLDDQVTEAGETVALQLSGIDPTDDPLTFAAVNLPYGLTLDAVTGMITGSAPRDPATYTVTVSVSDGWNQDSATFSWTIRPADDDGDGLPTDWELAHNLDPADPHDALLDPDQDAIPTLAEYLLGSEPDACSSVELTLETVARADGLMHPVVKWSRRTQEWSGAEYILERTEEPGMAWTPVTGEASVLVDGDLTSIEIEDDRGLAWESAEDKQSVFYRLRLQCLSGGLPWSYVTPVSAVMRLRCPQGSDARVGIPLRRAAAARALVGSHERVEGSLTIDAEGSPGWSESAFASGHYLRFETGELAGRTYRVLTNSANRLEVGLPAEAPMSVPASGDRFTIFPAWTLASLFGHPGLIFDDSSDFLGVNRGTEVLFYASHGPGVHRSAAHVFYRLPAPAGWRSTADAHELANDVIIEPAAQLAIRSAGPRITGDGWFTIAGTVEPGSVASLVTRQERACDVALGLQAAVPVKLRDLGLKGSFEPSAGSSPAARRDELMVYDRLANGLNAPPAAIYFFDGNAGVWKATDDLLEDAGDRMIPAAAGLVLRKFGGAETGAYWQLPPQTIE